jgi:Tfp pilus assembly protein PilO
VTTTQAQHTRTRTIVLGVAATFVALLGWLTWSDFQALEAARRETETARAATVKAQADIRTIPQLEEDVLVVRETVKRHVAILPDEKDINGFVERLSSFATDAGVKIVKLDDQEARARNSRQGKKATAAFDRISYKLSLTASTDSVLKFLDLFENHERFVKIPVFKVARAQETGNAADATASVPNDVDLELETYVYNPFVRAKDPITIPDEGRKLEGLAKRGLLAKVMSESVVPAAWRHDPSMMRRDPFVDPRIASARENERGEAARIAEEAELEQLVGSSRRSGERREEGSVRAQRGEAGALEGRRRSSLDAGRREDQGNPSAQRLRRRRRADALREGRPRSVRCARPQSRAGARHRRPRAPRGVARAHQGGRRGRPPRRSRELRGTGRGPAHRKRRESRVDLRRDFRRGASCARLRRVRERGYRVQGDDRSPRRSGAFRRDPERRARRRGEGVPGRPDITVRAISRVSVTFLFKGVAIERPVKGLAPKGQDPKTPPGRAGMPKKKN